MDCIYCGVPVPDGDEFIKLEGKADDGEVVLSIVVCGKDDCVKRGITEVGQINSEMDDIEVNIIEV